VRQRRWIRRPAVAAAASLPAENFGGRQDPDHRMERGAGKADALLSLEPGNLMLEPVDGL